MRSEPDSSQALEGGSAGRLPLADRNLQEFLPETVGAQETGAGDDGEWILAAQQAYRTSTDYFDGNLRRTIEESMDLYRSRHPAGSKYNLPSFAKRSRMFRPKTRSAMRKKEAAVAKAFFSTNDIVVCEAINSGDKKAVAAAKVQQELLNYRLQGKEMFWFQTVVGAFQDAARQGFVISRTDWDYRVGKRYYTRNGVREVEEFVARDTPCVRIVPGENFRIDPACDWRDPVGTSPYIIELMPMRVSEIRAMEANKQSKMVIRHLSDSALKSGIQNDWDSIRASREGSRQDRYDRRTGISSYDTVWVHRNIIRIEEEDYIFLTIGTEILLSEPMPLSELDPRGYRGYEFGFTMVESHNPFPDGEVQISKPLQEEINEVTNMRMDNVKMATIGRYFTKRGAQVDTDALVRFVPGSSIEMSNVNTDVRWDKAPDATRNSYEEQDRLNSEFDDLLGNFNGASVENNRRMNETVGGMELLSDSANEVTEFTIRTFSETWLKTVLGHCVDLIAIWETDQTIAAIVGQKVGMEAGQVFRSLAEKVAVSVNVGFGNTNPQARLRRIQTGFGILGGMFPELMQQADQTAIAGEIFGALGYNSVERFFPSMAANGGDPQVKQLTQKVQQLTQMLEGKQMEYQSREKIAQINAETKVRIEGMRGANNEKMMQIKRELDILLENGNNELKTIDLRLKFEQNAMKKQELYMQREALSHTIQMAEREFQLRVEEMRGERPEEQATATPPGVSNLVNSLRSPSSSAVPATAVPDESGVIARGNYGNIPFAEG